MKTGSYMNKFVQERQNVRLEEGRLRVSCVSLSVLVLKRLFEDLL